MVIKILGNCESVAFKAAEMFVKAKGHTLWCEGYRCDLAIAPLLTVKVSDEELKEATAERYDSSGVFHLQQPY